jgi:2-C-methyl-D-erythritol 4-phosphate cytidylyltransferase
VSARSGVAAIVLAAGGGSRMTARVNKVFLPIGGRAILDRSIGVFDGLEDVDTIAVVMAETDREAITALVTEAGFGKVDRLVIGGASRHESEFLGLLALADDIEAGRIELVLIHDAARPFVTPDRLVALIAAAWASGAAILATPAPAEMASVESDGTVGDDTPGLWVAQTPQAFHARLALDAHRRAAEEGFTGTDTSAVVERTGVPVSIVPGRLDNIKITTADDLIRGQVIVEQLDLAGSDQETVRPRL